jgi:hypothetical protein
VSVPYFRLNLRDIGQRSGQHLFGVERAGSEGQFPVVKRAHDLAAQLLRGREAFPEHPGNPGLYLFQESLLLRLAGDILLDECKDRTAFPCLSVFLMVAESPEG